MSNKDNNSNRKVVGFRQFDLAKEREELEKIKRSTIKNTPDQQQHIGNFKSKFNKITRKIDNLSPAEVDDKLKSIESLDENIQNFDGRVLYYTNGAYGQIFWDENDNIITGLHENDGNFRDQYMTKLFNHYGVEVEYVNINDIPDFVKEWDGYSDYD